MGKHVSWGPGCLQPRLTEPEKSTQFTKSNMFIKKKKKKPQQLQTPKCRRAWKAEKVWREGLLLRGYGAGINF